MKYRNTATQIKEIPIIFRGTIDGLPELAYFIEDYPEKVVDAETGVAYYEAFAIYATKFADQVTVWIDALDQLFVNVPRRSYEHEGNTYYYFGSEPTVATDPQDYPFSISIGSASNGGWKAFLHLHDISSADQPEQLELLVTDRDPNITSVKETLTAELTGNGQIKRFHIRFACGENGTLHVNPYVILNGNITINLCEFAKGQDKYLNGDNEEISFDCYVPIETHALVCLDVENVGEYTSIIDAAVVVQYEDFIEPESIVGYEGINLNRR